MKTLLIILSIAFVLPVSAQKADDIITVKEVRRIETALASDDMQGRKAGSAGSYKAAQFIASEFKKAGILPATKDTGYFQLVDSSLNAKGFFMANVVGILPGKSKPSEYVIFSAHYDHLGIGPAVKGDSIYNGANDDAAGVTAVIALAKYFKALNNNERTLVFAAFTAEEIGGFGSRHFSRQYNPQEIMAMFNIEMIGTRSKWGRNSAFITGYNFTDMGKILERNLKGTSFKFYPDPYLEQDLFYRSDNATLARLGVPAHTISTAKMENEKYYHTADDEIETLDMENMTAIIKAIAESSKTIISGKDTPTRVSTQALR